MFAKVAVFFFLILAFCFCFRKEEQKAEDGKQLMRLLDENKFDEAIDFSLKLSKKYPKDSGYIATTSAIYHGLGNDEKAREYILQAIEIEPNSGSNHANLGFIYYKKKDFKRALPPLSKGLELGGYSDPCKLTYAIGACSYELNDLENAAGTLLAFIQKCNEIKGNEIYLTDAKEILLDIDKKIKKRK
ncbi:tetratricopeptide repeat protein [Leptospira kobayashii]|nr:tetratricopeptide repeat protein [Leptospira kobayashii]